MEQPIIEKIIWFICEKFGHFKKGESWDYEGKTHFECKCCKRLISKGQP